MFSPHGCIHSTGSQAWEWGGHLAQALGGRAGLGDFALEGARSNSETPPVQILVVAGCCCPRAGRVVCGHLPQSKWVVSPSPPGAWNEISPSPWAME